MQKIKIDSEFLLYLKKEGNLSKRTLEIAELVCINNEKQSVVALKFDISKSAVSQAISRVTNEFEKKNLPKGYVKIAAILPEHQAYQVKVWSDKAKKQIEEKGNENSFSCTTKGRSG